MYRPCTPKKIKKRNGRNKKQSIISLYKSNTFFKLQQNLQFLLLLLVNSLNYFWLYHKNDQM